MNIQKKIAITIMTIVLVASAITVTYAYAASTNVPNNYGAYNNAAPYSYNDNTGSINSYGASGPQNGYVVPMGGCRGSANRAGGYEMGMMP